MAESDFLPKKDLTMKIRLTWIATMLFAASAFAQGEKPATKTPAAEAKQETKTTSDADKKAKSAQTDSKKEVKQEAKQTRKGQ